MNKCYFKTLKNIVFSFLCVVATSATLSLEAAYAPKDKIEEWVKSFPYIGLVASEITYGPITLKDLDLADCGRVIVAKPHETIHGTVKYEIESSQMDALKMHHIIVGIKDTEEGQNCITHGVGLWDSKGKAKFSISAPAEKGVYEVRFDYQSALICDSAIRRWQKHPPHHNATVGIIIVE